MTYFTNNLGILFSSYEILLTLMLTSIACSIVGVFLVLRKLSMVSDAISHTVLLGIVLAFFITKDISSPFLIIGAALFGVITVFAIESLSSTGLVNNDDAVGIIFPLFFAIAVILISRYARNVHLDTDVVLMGEVIMTPLNRIDILGFSLPISFVQVSTMLILNLLFVFIFFKELKVTTFDSEFATIAGLSSGILFYSLMALSSLTAVVAFETVGAILVISFLITPAASAYLITKDLKTMILVSILYSIVNSTLGYVIGMLANVSVSGMSASISGITFFMTVLFNKSGIITSYIKRSKDKEELKLISMLLHLGNHIGDENENLELGIDTIQNHLLWEKVEVNRISKRLIRRGLISIDNKNNTFKLTELGSKKYEEIKESYGV